MNEKSQRVWAPSSLEQLANPFGYVPQYVLKRSDPSRGPKLVFGDLWGKWRHWWDMGLSEAVEKGERIERENLVVGFLQEIWPESFPLKHSDVSAMTRETLIGAIVEWTWGGVGDRRAKKLAKFADGWGVEQDWRWEMGEWFEDLRGFEVRAIFDSIYLEPLEGSCTQVTFSEKKAHVNSASKYWWDERRESLQLRIQEALAWLWLERRETERPDAKTLTLGKMELECAQLFATRPVEITPEDWDIKEIKCEATLRNVAGILRWFKEMERQGVLTEEAWVAGDTPYIRRDYNPKWVSKLYDLSPRERRAWLDGRVDLERGDG